MNTVLFSVSEILRQHRTKTALRLSTTSACYFSVIPHKTRFDNRQVNDARFAHSDEKIGGVSAALSSKCIILVGKAVFRFRTGDKDSHRRRRLALVGF